jgi:protein subunit release factor A
MAVMDTILVEIRAAEGGDDARELVRDLAGIYGRRAQYHGL